MMVEKNLNALLVLILSSILLGAFSIQLFCNEQPCPLCLLQRLGMIGVATGALLNIRFGTHGAHYGLSLISAVFGGFVALRQIALHVCPDFPPFGEPFWGLSLYTWSFIIFASCVTYIAALLFIFDGKRSQTEKIGWLGQLAFLTVFLVAFGNIIGTFCLCGLGPCEG